MYHHLVVPLMKKVGWVIGPVLGKIRAHVLPYFALFDLISFHSMLQCFLHPRTESLWEGNLPLRGSLFSEENLLEVLRGFQRFSEIFEILKVFRGPLRDPLTGRFPSQRLSVLLPLIVLPLELSPSPSKKKDPAMLNILRVVDLLHVVNLLLHCDLLSRCALCGHHSLAFTDIILSEKGSRRVVNMGSVVKALQRSVSLFFCHRRHDVVSLVQLGLFGTWKSAQRKIDTSWTILIKFFLPVLLLSKQRGDLVLLSKQCKQGT